MSLLKYVDTKKTTIAVLRDWHTQQFKIDSAADDIASIDAHLKRVTPVLSATPGGSSGGNRVEERLVAGIAKKDAVMHGYAEALEYMSEFKPAWEQMTDEERYVLTVRYIEADRRDGVKRIMDRFFISRPEAYRRCEDALTKLSKLLYW